MRRLKSCPIRGAKARSMREISMAASLEGESYMDSSVGEIPAK